MCYQPSIVMFEKKNASQCQQNWYFPLYVCHISNVFGSSFLKKCSQELNSLENLETLMSKLERLCHNVLMYLKIVMH